MNPKAALKKRKRGIVKTIPLNFLLGCSELSLGNYELARLAEVGDLRKEFHLIFDRLIEQSALANLATWFRNTDRAALRYALENEETPIEIAKRLIRERRGDEQDDDLIPLSSLPPGAAHLAAAMRYQERNIAEGKCSICPKPLARNSVRLCEKHLREARWRKKPIGSAAPGSIDYLYLQEEQLHSEHGRHPNSATALATEREKKTREILAEVGIPFESAAVTLKGAKEALAKVMPLSPEAGKSQEELFHAAAIPTANTGRKALKEMLAGGQILRVGAGIKGDVYRYYQKQNSIPQTKSSANDAPET